MMRKCKINVFFAFLAMVCVVFSQAAYGLSIRDSIKVYYQCKESFDKGNYNEAIQCFTNVMQNSPESAIKEVAMYYKAMSYVKENNTGMAAQTFEQLIAKYKSGKWVKWAKQELDKM